MEHVERQPDERTRSFAERTKKQTLRFALGELKGGAYGFNRSMQHCGKLRRGCYEA
jgi:hypothetical protein